VAQVLNNIGILISSTDYAEARRFHERALAIREKTLGPDHPHFGLSLHNFALLVLRSRREKGQNTHPFFWAGFVAAGDWR
jgi:CHAT domain-containing protein